MDRSVPVKKAAVYGLVIAALLAVPLLTNGYTQYIVNLVTVYVVLGVGLNILLGYAGQFAFANAAFMGIGAYTTAILSSHFGMPFWICIPAAGIVTALIGSLCAVPAMRMASIYLALVTFAFAELMVWVFINWKGVTNGSNGIGVGAPDLFGYVLRGDKRLYYLLLPSCLAMLWLASRILKSYIGRSFVIIRESEIVARCNGINVGRTKMIAFALSALFGGVGGALFAYTVGLVLPQSFGLFQLIIHIAIVVLGGMASLAGAVIGAVLLTTLPEILRDFQSLQEVMFGTALVVVAIFMPRGIAGALTRLGLLPREMLVRGIVTRGRRPNGPALRHGTNPLAVGAKND